MSRRKRKQRARQRRRENRHQASLYYMARYHTKRAEGTVTPEIIEHLLEFQGHLCWYCRKRLTRTAGNRRNWALEHKTPISRGGTNDWANLVIACQVCNDFKGTQTAAEFLARSDRPRADFPPLADLSIESSREDGRLTSQAAASSECDAPSTSEQEQAREGREKKTRAHRVKVQTNAGARGQVDTAHLDQTAGRAAGALGASERTNSPAT